MGYSSGNENYEKCFIPCENMTRAMKLVRVLERNGIKSNVYKNVDRNGCSWGVQYNCANNSAVERIRGML